MRRLQITGQVGLTRLPFPDVDLPARTAPQPRRWGDIAAFLTAVCVRDPRATTTPRRLYQAYRAWCMAHGCVSEAARIFGSRLTQCGLPKSGAVWMRREKRLVRVRGGIHLAAEEPGAQAPYDMLLRQRHARERRPRQPPAGQLSLLPDASAGGR